MTIENIADKRTSNLASQLFGYNWENFSSPIEQIEVLGIVRELVAIQEDIAERARQERLFFERNCC